MYYPDDTIAAISSTEVGYGAAGRVIIRLSGCRAFDIASGVIQSGVVSRKRGIHKVSLEIEDLTVESYIYIYPGPGSYTGDDLVEIHLTSARCVVDILYREMLKEARQAKAGEFTARAYLNGRMDLMQAEAVSQIVSGSNQYQLRAAEKLLSGRVTDRIKNIRREILNLLSLLEAGMDFSEEDIEFISRADALESVNGISSKLQDILSGSIRCEEMIDMPSVGLAGLPNAGKSSLLNKLLGTERSIVSDVSDTTRDVLTGIVTFGSTPCALFDCAGLFCDSDTGDIISALTQDAARQALNSSDLIIYCIDISRNCIDDDLAVLRLLESTDIIYVLTKCDLVDKTAEPVIKKAAEEVFDQKVIKVSSFTGQGVDTLRKMITGRINAVTAPSCEMGQRIAINQRHRAVVSESMDNIDSSICEIASDNNEVAAMYLRSAYQGLARLESEKIDQVVLERIFANFCVGK